jgi:hypothetical protein
MKGEGIFSLMGKMDLTTLEIFQDRMEKRFLIKAVKEWNHDLEFSNYGKGFTYVDILTKNFTAFGTEGPG